MRVKGGKWGKVKGLGIYPYKEGKIKPYQRKIILNHAETLISDLNGTLINSIEYMDTNLTDTELIEQWNALWDIWGWYNPKWRDEWMDENIKIDDRFW